MAIALQEVWKSARNARPLQWEQNPLWRAQTRPVDIASRAQSLVAQEVAAIRKTQNLANCTFAGAPSLRAHFLDSVRWTRISTHIPGRPDHPVLTLPPPTLEVNYRP